MHRRRFLAALGTAAVASTTGCAALTSVAGHVDGDVDMSAISFHPGTYHATAGESVTWYNNSARAHSVTAYENQIPDGADYFASGGYDSEAAAREAWDGLNGALTNGDSYSHTFEVPGSYTYFCIPHEKAGMVGQVLVEE
ncbi:MAG: plastocyanin/azurin family copper-binding protein [Haloplanus sp.]